VTSGLSLVKIARILVVYWIAGWILSPIYCVLTTGSLYGLSISQLGILTGIDVAVLLLLVYPVMQRRLGRSFFPLVVALCSLPFLLEKLWMLLIAVAPGSTDFDSWRAIAVRQDYLLLVLLIAWQYRFAYAIAYIGLISFSDWALTILITHHIEATWGSMLPSLAGRAILLLLASYVVSWLRQQQQRQQSALIEAHQHQVEANTKLARYAASVEQLSISRERNRLARELHDTLAHSLSAIIVQLEAVKSLWDVDAVAARKMLNRADDLTRSGLTEARRSLQSLRATPLEQFGLALALRDIAESAAQRADLMLELEVPELAVNLPAHIEQSIYRIAQEALENVVRHARAHMISVKLLYNTAELQFIIIDDGIGFTLEQLSRSINHWGIRGMQERAVGLGSTLNIVSEPDHGTRLSLCLKVEELWKNASPS